MTVKAVLFDMDGVLVDSEKHHEARIGPFFRRIAPGWKKSDYKIITGRNFRDNYDFLHEERGLELSFEETRTLAIDFGKIVYEELCDLLPGAKESLAALQKAGYQLALVSSSPRPWIKIVIERFALAEFFDLVISGDDIQGKGKPAPDIYLLAAKQLSLAPETCIVVEDSETGIAAGKAAGMRVIALETDANGGHELSQADILTKDLVKIPKIIST